MSYTLGQAAKATGISKATIHRAVQSGKVSATKSETTGAWLIDPAELHRVFPAVSLGQLQNGSVRQSEITIETLLRQQLEQEREERQQERSQLEGTITDLREDRDRWRTQAEKLLLTDQRAKAPDVIAMPPVSPPHVSPAPTPTEALAAAEPAPAADNQPQHYPARVVVKKAPAPKKTPKPEVGWWRKMIDGR
jgi:hypothetical protein